MGGCPLGAGDIHALLRSADEKPAGILELDQLFSCLSSDELAGRRCPQKPPTRVVRILVAAFDLGKLASPRTPGESSPRGAAERQCAGELSADSSMAWDGGVSRTPSEEKPVALGVHKPGLPSFSSDALNGRAVCIRDQRAVLCAELQKKASVYRALDPWGGRPLPVAVSMENIQFAGPASLALVESRSCDGKRTSLDRVRARDL